MPEILMHLRQLSKSFHVYIFTENISKIQRWILSPFLFDPDSRDKNDLIQYDFIERSHSEL